MKLLLEHSAIDEDSGENITEQMEDRQNEDQVTARGHEQSWFCMIKPKGEKVNVQLNDAHAGSTNSVRDRPSPTHNLLE